MFPIRAVLIILKYFSIVFCIIFVLLKPLSGDFIKHFYLE
ncbi:CLUMA_CG014975, isoform A [Clunio marinus]|uniref:CLUMA_CG014975, isoform A n=1 Tax=Clunio marinus TaxID=568069 RepID=A0A1J1INE5_9DIPT|nr:CLUMA_CG014975, isoform A [Clunio marinus]